MELFESFGRRIEQIKPVMDKYGIKDFDDARKICTDKGFDPYEIVKSIVFIKNRLHLLRLHLLAIL